MTLEEAFGKMDDKQESIWDEECDSFVFRIIIDRLIPFCRRTNTNMINMSCNCCLFMDDKEEQFEDLFTNA